MEASGRSFGISKTAFFLVFALVFVNYPVYAFEPGKTYDQSNWQEIQDDIPATVLKWVKTGKCIIPTAKVAFEGNDWKKDDDYLRAGKKNEGRYDFDKDNFLIEKSTGERPLFHYGFVFPTIDLKDPKAGQKIMENYSCQFSRQGGIGYTSKLFWINPSSGCEREVVAGGYMLHYLNRDGGQIPNPDRIYKYAIICVFQPYDIRGTVSLTTNYIDKTYEGLVSYIPMVRRVRRMSPAAKSDPFLGSDITQDDANVWGGKNTAMKWRLIGQKRFLMPFSSEKAYVVKQDSNGAVNREYITRKLGFMVPGWKNALWAPEGVVWSPRPVWMVEAIPRDPYYAAGSMIFYLDQNAYNAYIRESYARDGSYWKTLVCYCSYQITDKGTDALGNMDAYTVVDEKANHATSFYNFKYENRESRINLPSEIVGPDLFLNSSIINMSK